jgi:hypothetical protein
MPSFFLVNGGIKSMVDDAIDAFASCTCQMWQLNA